jgi:hypothetical protein
VPAELHDHDDGRVLELPDRNARRRSRWRSTVSPRWPRSEYAIPTAR